MVLPKKKYHLESGLYQRDEAESAAPPIKSFVKTAKIFFSRGYAGEPAAGHLGRDVEYEFGGRQIRIWGHVFRQFHCEYGEIQPNFFCICKYGPYLAFLHLGAESPSRRTAGPTSAL